MLLKQQDDHEQVEWLWWCWRVQQLPLVMLIATADDVTDNALEQQPAGCWMRTLIVKAG